MANHMRRVIGIDPEKCVNCHNCIAVCPVKYCNDASGDAIVLDEELCIGCGECIKACSHGSRYAIDNTEDFIKDVRSGVNMVAIIAPAVAASFPGQTERMVGWLKSIGVRAVFDVSFGAELTVKSYVEHIQTRHPKTCISQPCPAIVTFIEMYQPDLLPYLAPAHSPMLHTIKMIKEYYPEYAHYKVVALSPCLAKRREFDETGLGDYNVTFGLLKKYFEREHIDLNSYPETEFDGPIAERAVLFSAPGGLMRTLERWDPSAHATTRKIEGPQTVYPYFREVKGSILNGHVPAVIDCLNCEKGCNGGTGTGMQDTPYEELEYYVDQRRIHMEELHKRSGLAFLQTSEQRTAKALAKIVESKWKPGLYDRSYIDRSRQVNIMIPSKEEFDDIYRQMGKREPKDHLNCSACGYGTCEKMAIAIYNGLNKVQNCFLYRERMIEHLASSLSQQV